MSKISISDALFTKTQQRVLGLLYGNPAKSFYTNEIVRWADMGRGTIRRELQRLVRAGLLLDKREGNQLHYQANSANPIYKELLGIVRKTFGLVEVITQAFRSIDQPVDFAFIYGSIAKGEDTASSDIDLMVVANTLAYADLMVALSDAEKSLGRPINPTIYNKAEIKRKLSGKSAFLTRVLKQPKLWIKGTEDDISEFG